MPPVVLFLIFAIVLLGIIYLMWRYWFSIAHLSPEEEEFDERVAALNEYQANRLSDEQLTHPASEDDAWQIMVSRGQRAGKRRDRYAGDTARRANERRQRSRRAGR